MSKVHLVCSSDYEEHNVVRVFATRKRADAFMKKCQDYEAKNPLNGNDRSDDAWERFNVWNDKHPAGMKRARFYGVESHTVRP